MPAKQMRDLSGAAQGQDSRGSEPLARVHMHARYLQGARFANDARVHVAARVRPQPMQDVVVVEPAPAPHAQ